MSVAKEVIVLVRKLQSLGELEKKDGDYVNWWYKSHNHALPEFEDLDRITLLQKKYCPWIYDPVESTIKENELEKRLSKC